MSSGRLFGICGSLRKASVNRQLMHAAVRAFDPAAFIEGDLRLPLYDGDLEDAEGVPAAVETLAEGIKAADAVLVVTPEYNQNLSGVLKNALDWISRTKIGPWRDKPVAILSAAAGRAGGARAQYSLRHCLVPFRPRVLAGPEVLVAHAGDQFDADGILTNEMNAKQLAELMAALRAEAGL